MTTVVPVEINVQTIKCAVVEHVLRQILTTRTVESVIAAVKRIQPAALVNAVQQAKCVAELALLALAC
jgi:hypothetical protein